MADWVHCNSCYSQPSGDETKFYLTSCGHMFCEVCINKGAANPACKVCNQATGTVEINRQMRSDLQLFFIDPRELAKRHDKQLRQVMSFQTVHRERYIKYCLNQLKHAGRMVQYFQQETKKREDFEKKYEKAVQDQRVLRDENRQLKDAMKQMLQQQSRSPKTPKLHGTYRQQGTPGTGKSNPSTPCNPLLVSFDGVTTSTPANAENGFAWTGAGQNAGDTAVSASPAVSEITTPKMLGLKKTPTNSTSQNSNYERMWQSAKISRKSPSAAQPRAHTPNNQPNHHHFANLGPF